MAKEQYMDIITKVMRDTNWEYGDLREDGNGENEYVLLVYNWEGADKLNELFRAELKANNIDTFPDYDHDTYYIDFATGDNWGFSESFYVCEQCQKAYRYVDGYGGYNEYFVGDGYIICSDCVKEGYIETYINTLVDNPLSANTIFTEEELEERGFKRLNYNHYENGMYPGQNDSPREIYENLRETGEDGEILFSIYKTYNPFEIQFDVYVREV